MRTAYFDASAVVKLGVHERESEALVEYLQQPGECSTSAVSGVEVVRALRRLAVDDTETATALGGFFLIDLSATLLKQAAVLQPLPLRTLDAIHLATALAINDPELEFLTYDATLARAALAHGLTVVQPGRDAQSPS